MIRAQPLPILQYHKQPKLEKRYKPVSCAQSAPAVRVESLPCSIESSSWSTRLGEVRTPARRCGLWFRV